VTLSDTQRRLVRVVTGVVAVIIAVPITLVVAWFVYSRYVIWRYDQPFERVARGDTEEHVIALLGKPHRIATEHQTRLAWRSGEHEQQFDGDCVVQFRYIPWSPTGDEYVIGFDSSKHATSKYEITSP
jgi:hypothetical protein